MYTYMWAYRDGLLKVVVCFQNIVLYIYVYIDIHICIHIYIHMNSIQQAHVDIP